ncbi:uncharacterized protein TNCV_4769401 [Trichonephila clavipes]|nr:uncharacterized protein TNCV_4769401 [Trichonephila clavipes]
MLTAVPLGLGLNPGEDMDVCKCIVPSRHGGTLNSRRAASPLVGLVEGIERWPSQVSSFKIGVETSQIVLSPASLLSGQTRAQRQLYTRVCGEFVILNHDQVTRVTPKLAPLSQYFHTTPTGGRLCPDRFNVPRLLYTAGIQRL